MVEFLSDLAVHSEYGGTMQEAVDLPQMMAPDVLVCEFY